MKLPWSGGRFIKSYPIEMPLSTDRSASSMSPVRTISIPPSSSSSSNSHEQYAERFSPPPNKRLKLAGPAFRGSVCLCTCVPIPHSRELAPAPQLKRDPLGGSLENSWSSLGIPPA